MSPTPAAERVAEIETLKELAIRLEAFETPQWAIDEILKVELLTRGLYSNVIDPCCGRGIMTEAARAAGYEVWPLDIHDWGFECAIGDFLDWDTIQGQLWGQHDHTVFMNPPFSLAEKFVLKAISLGARKIVYFQRLAWWESQRRKTFWDKHPPNRIYICGSRTSCWRFDIPKEDQKSGTTTAHAWFVWERGHPAGPVISRIYQDAP